MNDTNSARETPRESTGRHRIVHVGTGLTGREVLRGIIEDPALDLVGLKVSSPDKVGLDAGTLCGLPDTGIAAVADLETVIELEPACVAYCATAVRREDEAIDDIAQFLRSGIDVVTMATIPLVFPPAAPRHWLTTLEAAADEGGSTFYATGSEPGVASLNLPIALMAGAGRVDSYRMDEYALGLDQAYPVRDVLHESMGFGKPDGHVPARIASGKVTTDWSAVVLGIADALAITLDDIDLDWETVLAPNDLDTAVGVIPGGTVCAHRWLLAGMVDDEPVVGVQYFATLSSTPWPETWPRPQSFTTGGGMVYRVEGRPSMQLELRFERSPGEKSNPGVVVTAMAVVNAIPSVIESGPGVITEPLSGSAIVTRQASASSRRRSPS
jgi:hypothetical protein